MGCGRCPESATGQRLAPAAQLLAVALIDFAPVSARNAHADLRGVASLSSHLLVGPRMVVSFGIEFHHGFVDSAVEVIRTSERLMSEMMSLQVAPENLD